MIVEIQSQKTFISKNNVAGACPNSINNCCLQSPAAAQFSWCIHQCIFVLRTASSKEKKSVECKGSII